MASLINFNIKQRFYLHFKENLFRISNIHLIKPFKGNCHYIDKMYDLRYQKKIVNIFKFAKNLLGAPNFYELCKFYIKLQLALFNSFINL